MADLCFIMDQVMSDLDTGRMDALKAAYDFVITQSDHSQGGIPRVGTEMRSHEVLPSMMMGKSK